MAIDFGSPDYVEEIPSPRQTVTRAVTRGEAPAALSVDEAAAFLGGVHRSTIYDMAKRGEFRMLKMGGRTIIPRGDLIAYLDRLPSLYGPVQK